MTGSDEPTSGVTAVLERAAESKEFFTRLLQDPRGVLMDAIELRALTTDDVEMLTTIIEQRRDDTTKENPLELWDRTAGAGTKPPWADWPIHRPPHAPGRP